MFTGIIEGMGVVKELQQEGSNLHITIESPFTAELQVDQSVAHNGVCLTVVNINGNCYTVTAIAETLEKSNLGVLKQGDNVNLERSMKLGERLDGHIVQGHVDSTAKVLSITEQNGSWVFTFEMENTDQPLVEKGSISINGVSLTVFNILNNQFSVAIIPYTFSHTNFGNFKPGDTINIEYDVIGKYVQRLLKSQLH
jgi:riboflavin synthase